MGIVGCYNCTSISCPQMESECPAGIVKDVCGCCSTGVCGKKEGQKCFNETLIESLTPKSRQFGLCGSYMDCLRRFDLTDTDIPEALCVCNDNRKVCGSNNITYDSICKLKSESAKESKPVYVTSWKPCLSAPEITNGPQDVTIDFGQALNLECEIRGNPVPVVKWQFVSFKDEQRVLPGDDPMTTVQFRGGPEPYMMTSWIQIVSFRETDEGYYVCIAINSQGEARDSAVVNFIRRRYDYT